MNFTPQVSIIEFFSKRENILIIKVYSFLQAQHKTEDILAAAKIIIVNDETDLEDFMVEIDILSEIKHKNIVGLHETYYHNGKLWVSRVWG